MTNNRNKKWIDPKKIINWSLASSFSQLFRKPKIQLAKTSVNQLWTPLDARIRKYYSNLGYPQEYHRVPKRLYKIVLFACIPQIKWNSAAPQERYPRLNGIIRPKAQVIYKKGNFVERFACNLILDTQSLKRLLSKDPQKKEKNFSTDN